MRDIGIYVHIPFCVKKCDYCDFTSFGNVKEEIIYNYIKELNNNIKEELTKEKYDVKTVYFGGGTPSYINSNYIVEILNTIKQNSIINQNAEITIEVNPGTVTKEKLQQYKNVGINRLSIGLQETHNNLLKSIGRIHSYEDFLSTYNLARKTGFNNINVDLIIGLPKQSIQDIKENLEKIINLKPEHISVYSLILEENTVLYNKYQNGEIELPSDIQERNMYWYVKNTLENNGFKHYEISNFSRPGLESKHNTDCWKQKEYLGFGLSAHSYIDGKRYSNEMDEKNIIYKFKKVIHEEQDTESMQKEYMLLGLRMIDGVSIREFKNKFSDNPIFIFRKELEKLVNEQLLKIDGDRIKLTNKGLNLANIVWEEFI